MFLSSAEIPNKYTKSDDLRSSPFNVDLKCQPHELPPFVLGKRPLVEKVDGLQALLKESFEDANFAYRFANAQKIAEAFTHHQPPSNVSGYYISGSGKLLTDKYTTLRPICNLEVQHFRSFISIKIVRRSFEGWTFKAVLSAWGLSYQQNKNIHTSIADNYFIWYF